MSNSRARLAGVTWLGSIEITRDLPREKVVVEGCGAKGCRHAERRNRCQFGGAGIPRAVPRPTTRLPTGPPMYSMES